MVHLRRELLCVVVYSGITFSLCIIVYVLIYGLQLFFFIVLSLFQKSLSYHYCFLRQSLTKIATNKPRMTLPLFSSPMFLFFLCLLPRSVFLRSCRLSFEVFSSHCSLWHIPLASSKKKKKIPKKQVQTICYFRQVYHSTAGFFFSFLMGLYMLGSF